MMGGIPSREIDALEKYWKAFPNLKEQLFAGNDTPYSELKHSDVKSIIEASEDVKGFISHFNEAFEDMECFLVDRLIRNMSNVQPVKEENEIGNNKALLGEELRVITEKEERIVEIASTYEELIESLSEEDKESELVNEAQDAFNAKAVAARIKELKKPESDEEKELKKVLTQYTECSKEEKALKKEVKELTATLHLKTKVTIEGLTDEQADELVAEKWIKPLIASLIDLPNQIITALEKEVQTLSEKYATTLTGIEEEIETAENVLGTMLDDLCGSEFDMKGLASLKALLGGE